MKQIALFVVSLTTLLFSASIYVSDSFEITMRRRPANGSKIVKMLNSGDELTVLSRGKGWIQIRDKRSGKSGWVLNRFTMTKVPAGQQVATLTTERDNLQHLLDSTNSFYESMKKNYTELDSLKTFAEGKQKEYQDRFELLQKDNLRMGAIIAAAFLVLGMIVAHIPSPAKKKRRRY